MTDKQKEILIKCLLWSSADNQKIIDDNKLKVGNDGDVVFMSNIISFFDAPKFSEFIKSHPVDVNVGNAIWHVEKTNCFVTYQPRRKEEGKKKERKVKNEKIR